MLSEKTIAIVKITVPVLQAGGEALTRHFYERMFANNPEVLPYFNPANQAKGAQQKALAAAICAYAENINNLEVLGDAVELIAQKHASLRIQPEHYPIVGENLLESIKEVLGDAATPEIIEAWGEAYGFLADILIGREKQIYAEQQEIEGGWKDFKNFKVTKKIVESDVITSFYLEPEDGSAPPIFKAGQYITVRMPSPCGHTTMRNYSLSDKPKQKHFRISVKREDGADAKTPEGYVSHMLHNNVEVGHSIEIAPPCGEFFLGDASSRPLVLMAAGVGITPILSMLLTSLELAQGREILFIYASLDEANHAFKGLVDELSEKHSNLTVHYRYSDGQRLENEGVSTGFVDSALIQSLVKEVNSDYYFCGPKPFMINAYNNLLELGAPSGQVHFEFFGPKQEIENPQETKAA